jgi:tRNA nucleotidyltransferase/poly(A) polymerase
LGVDHHVYVVGGAVRNFVLNEPIKDVDVMVDSINSSLDSLGLAQALSQQIPSSSVVENNYGVAIINVSSNSSWSLEGHSFAGEVIEIANSRKESYGEGGYKPSDVEPATIQEDVYRREFTFNTLMWRLSEVANGVDKAQIIDITGCGLTDLQNRQMVCPSDPNKTFRDDPSRMIRAIKFLVKYGFEIPPQTRKAIKANAQWMKNIPSSALSALLLGSVLSNEAYIPKALSEMDSLGLLDNVRDRLLSEKPFRRTFENWSKSIGVVAMLDVMDMGLPFNTPLGRFSRKEQTTIRENVVGMTREEALSYLFLLQKPTTIFSNKRFLSGLIPTGLAKREIGVWMRDQATKLREGLLSNPQLTEREARSLLL